MSNHIKPPVGIDENGNLRWRHSFKGKLTKIFNLGWWCMGKEIEKGKGKVTEGLVGILGSPGKEKGEWCQIEFEKGIFNAKQ